MLQARSPEHALSLKHPKCNDQFKKALCEWLNKVKMITKTLSKVVMSITQI